MGSLLVQEKDIIIPGEILAEGMDYLPGENTYRENDKIHARVLGLVTLSGRVVKVTPLSGPYVPMIGDKIIAKVVDITMSGWRLNTNTAYLALLNVKDATTRFVRKQEDLSQIIAIGEYVIVMIINVTSQRLIDASMREPGLQKIVGGRIIEINSQKVPRIIGKKGSMISLIKTHTGCEITVGQNGLIWIKGTPEGEHKAELAIKIIEERSHLSGLTEAMEKYLGETHDL